MNRQSHIDGLRAVAVIAVVLFHSGQVLPAGFLGVDIFFTISGYLIAFIVTTEHSINQFSYKKFVSKRIVRLIPALYAMTLVSLLLAPLFLHPFYLKEVSNTLPSLITFTSNYYFMSLQGYFSPELESHIFLHTWSVAVEMQLYAIFLLIFFLF